MAAYGEICSGDQGSCLLTFLENHPEFQYVRVPDDGDCFFHSLAAYYARTGEHIDGVRDPSNPLQLRQYVVQEFIEMVRQNPDLRSTLSPKNIKSLKDLYQSGVWARNSFDTMISTVPAILHINLEIYGVYSDAGQFIITRTMYEGNGGSTISLFLASNHYGLLYPIDGVNHRSNKKKKANEKVIANINAQHAANEAATAKLLASYKKKNGVNQEQANLNAAIAASMQNFNIQNQQVLNNAAFAASLQELNFNSNNRKSNNNSNALSVVSNVSSVGSINGINIENAKMSFPYKETTIKEIKEYLNEYGIKYDKKSTKENLYGELLMAYIANVIQRTKNTLKKKKYKRKVEQRRKSHKK